MVGKATLLVVAAFSLLFLVVEYNMGSVSTRAVSNFVEYYLENYAHEAAVSGADMAANEIFINKNWTAGYSNMNFNGAKVNVQIITSGTFNNEKKIVSTAVYQGVTKTVEIKLAPSKFSKFAYYSGSEGSNIWWMDKDTVWGPFHTQDKMRISGHPTFYGKVTNLNGIQTYDPSSSANFYGGYETGVDLPIPLNGVSDIGIEAGIDGVTISGQNTVYLTFDTDSIKVKFNINGVQTSYLASAFSSNGVIFVNNADAVRLMGTVKGQFTVASNSGNVYLDDDVVYKTNPKTNENSTDLLGIVSKNDVIVTNNLANITDININASIYCESGSFQAEDWNNRPVSGGINLIGGIIQNTRGPVGRFSGSAITSGFYKNYKYDERLLLAFPPAFPGTGGYEIVSWYE